MAIGDYVNFDYNGDSGWGKIMRIQQQGNYGEEYQVLTTVGNLIWIPEDYIWEKIIEGVRPECRICFNEFTNNTIISIPTCGHILCRNCANRASTYRGQYIPKDLPPGQFDCGACGTRNTYPLPQLRVRFNEFKNLLCHGCKMEITEDMPLYAYNGRLLCCFCSRGNNFQPIFLL